MIQQVCTNLANDPISKPFVKVLGVKFRKRDMNYIKKLNILSLVFTFGCASKTVKLVSDPPAKVFVSKGLSSEFTELGTTPLDVKLKEHASEDRFTYLNFQAEGHDGYRVVLPANYTAGTVEIKLNENEKVKEIEERVKTGFSTQMKVFKTQIAEQRQKHQEEKDRLESTFKDRSNEIFQKVIEIQNALHIKRLPKAGRALAELKVLGAPESLIFTLKGNFEFISGKPRRALASYRRALEIDPNNVELAGILRELGRVVK